eukprot:scaffold55884_cov22-Cyclotella_meneghiniana.AAC.2
MDFSFTRCSATQNYLDELIVSADNLVSLDLNEKFLANTASWIALLFCDNARFEICRFDKKEMDTIQRSYNMYKLKLFFDI